jgi:uncharacterized protein (TIGR03437 family)
MCGLFTGHSKAIIDLPQIVPKNGPRLRWAGDQRDSQGGSVHRAISVVFIATCLVAAESALLLAQDCPAVNAYETDPTTPLTYPMTSNRYAVQYQLGGSGAWTNAQVYISYFGGTLATPFLAYAGYTLDTSMSFVSIPAGPGTAVALRVTKLWGSNFPAINQISVRPRAKGIQVSSVSAMTVQLSTTTSASFAGDQFILWWNLNKQEGAGIQGLAVFLDPPYTRPTGSNVKTIAAPVDLTGDLSSFDTLDFEGTVAVGSTGAQAFLVPANIKNIFLAPGGWLQGKLRFEQNGAGNTRRIYGPGVVDASRFSYKYRLCASTTAQADDGYNTISFIAPPAGTPGHPSLPDQFLLDGIILSDGNHYATDLLEGSVLNNTKSISWNGNNDGFEFGTNASASNVFVRSGDDSLKIWRAPVTITNATVWQNWNGGVVNLGWGANSAGDASSIDGLYVVKTDWRGPKDPNWTVNGSTDWLNYQNVGIVASLMTPGTKFGAVEPPVFRNIYVEDPPQVFLSLKILPPDCYLGGRTTCPALAWMTPSVLNLNLVNVFMPASIVENSIGFETVAGFAGVPDGSTLTGSMNIGLTNVMITSPDGTETPLTSANAESLGKLSTNGDHVNIQFGPPTITLVANAFGDTPTIAPNMWVEIKGSNLAPLGDSRIWQSRDFVNNQLPKQLDGVSVTVNGKDAYLWFVSPAQVNILTPPDAIEGPVKVVLTNVGAASAPFSVQAQTLAPAFFVFDGVHVTGVHTTGGDIGPTSLYPGLTTPAKPGETIVLFGNGFGPTSTPVVSGAPAQSGSLSPLPVVKIGGVTATVQFAGLVAPGEFQFNVVVPPSLADGDQPIVATYNGQSTQPGVLLAAQH